jgi:hypothetical protein
MALHDEDLNLLVRDPVVYVFTLNPARFEVDTSTNAAVIGGAVGGAIGAVAVGAIAHAAAQTNQPGPVQNDPRALIRSTAYEDPANQTREHFVSLLRNELKLSKFTFIEEPQPSEFPRNLAGRFDDGLVLAFKTEEWVLESAPFSSHFWIRYRASALLYSPKEERPIWRELCGFMPKDSTASLAELAANSGEGLRTQLQTLGKLCAEQLIKEILDRPSRQPSQ